MKKIILTGGGTAGHITPNLALLPYLKEAGFDVAYIGSRDSIESRLIPEAGIPFHEISTGKLRRYLSLKNLTDPFRVVNGISQAKKIIREFKPDIVFSKGGYVGLPVAVAAKKCHVPVILHESDMTPGLANKLCLPYAEKICCNFPETVKVLPEDKAVLTGSPIRDEILKGDPERGFELCHFQPNKPVILVIGGSLGAAAINEVVRKALPVLLKDFQIVHLCGRGKLDESIVNTPGYIQFEYVTDDLRHLFAITDLVISRAGANSICELLALKKPNLLIPLSKGSRGDQILNAASFESQGYSAVLSEKDMTPESLVERVTELYFTRQTYIENMSKSVQSNANRKITELIRTLVAKD
ncbi:MAG: undecaprenyldiphospho-muramoylpentapeptide beta-N-acetylglucosaminyltransferase [Lachnospiraceae bacterium]|nr:undecaprenyldiphospho-muramoylpentapeptide beta-N-acetylglucosaminyltransferase [Lachnospiraceae bacterium]